MSIQHDDTNAGVLILKPGASGNYSVTWPTANASGALTNDGSGNMSWTPATGGSSTITFNAQSTNYTIVAGDLGKVIKCTAGAITLSVTAAATLGAGFFCWVWNTAASAITIDPNASEKVEGNLTLSVAPMERVKLVCDGTAFFVEKSLSAAVFHARGDNTAYYGMASATGLNAMAMGSGTAASGSHQTALGANSGATGSQTATGAGAMALGGSYASGTDSFAAAIANNTSSYGAQGANSVAMGKTAFAFGTESTAIGRGSYASSSGAFALGNVQVMGYGAKALAGSAYAFGDGAQALQIGKWAYTSYAFVTNGDGQYGQICLFGATTDATPKVLTSYANAAGSNNQLILANNQAFAFDGIIVARQSAAQGTASAAWQVSGLIRREANAGTTTLVASTVTAISNVPGWTLALSADTTNGGLAVTFTGAAATNIRTVATIRTSEVIYA